MQFIDNILNRITMYRFVLYYLIFLWLAALVLSVLGILPYSPVSLFYTLFFLTLISWITNTIFAWVFKVQTNVESVYITALILALIITPLKSPHDTAYFWFLAWAAIWANASKYIFAIGKKHVFNPAAFAVALTALTINQSASWWVGTASMLPFVLIGGFLMVRKLRRWDAVLAFIIAAFVTMIALSSGLSNGLDTIRRAVIDSPIFFLAAVMFTEPLTMPPTRDGRIAYGILVGWLFAPQTHFGSFYFTPELALLAGNVFSYIISPKGKHILTLKEKRAAGHEVYDFVFENKTPLKFRPGQYMEWTLDHDHPDSRGNRRYFTLASSPTEREVLLGVKFYENPSSFKKQLLSLNPGDTIMAGSLAGDFTLPGNPKEKLAFLAGGIGITPFRSMLKYLVDKGEHRDVVMFYSNRMEEEVVYDDVLYDAYQKLGVRTVATLTDQNVRPDWKGYRGYFSADIIAREVPDYKERIFYISGSHVMVEAFKKMLTGMGVSRRKIKTDFFPGLA